MSYQHKVEQYAELITSMYEEGYSIREIGRHLHENELNGVIGISALRKWIARLIKDGPGIDYSRPQISHQAPKPSPDSEKPGKQWEYTENTAIFNYKGPQRITTLEEALEFCQADLGLWEVKDWRFNSWETTAVKDGEFITTTNYQVKVSFQIKAKGFNWEDFHDDITRYIKRSQPKITDGTGEALAALGDLHAGAKTGPEFGLIKTNPTSVDILCKKLRDAADRINRYKFQHVDVALVGDLVETITGLNHINVWQEIESGWFGGNAILGAFRIIKECFLDRIHNLRDVYILSGNHDRLSSNKDVDRYGAVAQIIAKMLELCGYSVKWHPMLISVTIDKVQYVLTHNHLGFTKQNLGEIFFKYGDQKRYNVLIGGHYHSRGKRRPVITSEEIPLDGYNYRAVNLAPMFAGNFYSESTGWTSNCGFSIFSRFKKSVDHLDLAI